MAGKRSAVLSGVLVGVLLFTLGFGGYYAWQHSSVGLPDDTSQPSSSSAPEPPGDSALPQTDRALAKFYDQELTWKKCGGNLDCTRLTVPLDYADPSGETVSIAVLRVRASQRDKRVGQLVVNPGGPGGSGIQYAAAGALQFGKLARRYDIVGFDPRGVGQSEGLTCVGTKDLDQLVAFDPDPDNDAERDEMDTLVKRFGDGCLAKSGDLARHMSTDEVARDLDVLRQALKEAKLDYMGASYGTLIGATYANLFPTHVGRMVLDGALDPSLSNEELSLQQAHGFEVALRSYVKDCVNRGNCFLGDTVDAGVRRIQKFLAAVEARPLPTDTDRELTEGLATLGVWMPLYVESYWGQLSSGLKQAFDDGRGSRLLSLADLYTSRGSEGYTDNSMNALYAVNCLDHSDSIPTDDVPSHFAEFEKASPTFGKAFAYSLSTCSSWPVKSGKVTKAMAAAGAPPIVVLGTTRDPATPVEWARALASQLDSGVYVERDGDGHTAYNQGNECIDTTVVRYLVDDKVPADNTKC